MKTIFSAGKKSLRGPRFVVVYAAKKGHLEYELTHGANEAEQREWQWKHVEWGKQYGGRQRVAYIINVYPRVMP